LYIITRVFPLSASVMIRWLFSIFCLLFFVVFLSHFSLSVLFFSFPHFFVFNSFCKLFATS
jgi:hypothetical protein